MTASVMAVGTALAFAGCTSEDGISSENSQTLLDQIETVRSVTIGDTPDCTAAESSVVDLRGQIAELGDGVDTAIREALLDGAQNLGALVSAECASTTTPVVPEPVVPEPEPVEPEPVEPDTGGTDGTDDGTDTPTPDPGTDSGGGGGGGGSGGGGSGETPPPDDTGGTGGTGE